MENSIRRASVGTKEMIMVETVLLPSLPLERGNVNSERVKLSHVKESTESVCSLLNNVFSRSLWRSQKQAGQRK
jgi:hypothetical protein